MARLFAWAVILAVLLGGCAGLSLSAWDNTSRDRCDEEHINGRWSLELCRQGKGVLVWWNWVV